MDKKYTELQARHTWRRQEGPLNGQQKGIEFDVDTFLASIGRMLGWAIYLSCRGGVWDMVIGKHRVLPQRKEAVMLRKEFATGKLFYDFVALQRTNGVHLHIVGVGGVEGVNCTDDCPESIKPFKGDVGRQSGV